MVQYSYFTNSSKRGNMIQKIAPGQVLYAAASSLYRDGDGVVFHPNTACYASRGEARRFGRLAKGTPTLEVRGGDNDELFCETPPEGFRLREAGRWTRRSLKVILVDADGNPHDGLPDFLR